MIQPILLPRCAREKLCGEAFNRSTCSTMGDYCDKVLEGSVLP